MKIKIKMQRKEKERKIRKEEQHETGFAGCKKIKDVNVLVLHKSLIYAMFGFGSRKI